MDAEEFRNAMIDVVANAELSIDTAYYVMKDVFGELEKTYQQYLIDKRLQKEKKEEVSE